MFDPFLHLSGGTLHDSIMERFNPVISKFSWMVPGDSQSSAWLTSDIEQLPTDAHFSVRGHDQLAKKFADLILSN